MSNVNSVTDLFADDPDACPACERIGAETDTDGILRCTNDCRVIRYEIGE